MRRYFRAPSAGRHMLVSAGVRNHCPRFQQAQTRVNWAVQGFGWLPFVGAFGAIVVHRASEGYRIDDAVLSRCSGRLLPTRAPCGMNFDADAGLAFACRRPCGVNVSTDTASGLPPRLGTRAEHVWRISISCFCGSVQPAAGRFVRRWMAHRREQQVRRR